METFIVCVLAGGVASEVQSSEAEPVGGNESSITTATLFDGP